MHLPVLRVDAPACPSKALVRETSSWSHALENKGGDHAEKLRKKVQCALDSAEGLLQLSVYFYHHTRLSYRLLDSTMCLLALTASLLALNVGLDAARLPAAIADASTGTSALQGRLLHAERRELISNGSPAPPSR